MTGQVIYGDKFFPRPKDENRIWRRLSKGSPLLVLAPRRVGKTSLLRHMETNPKDGYVFLYSIVQSCSNEHEYYKEILNNLFNSEFTNRMSKAKHWGQDKLEKFTSSVKGLNLSEAGIEFDNKDRKLDRNDLKTALNAINIEDKLIIVIDEFPDVLEKINREHGHSVAESFLSGCRDLCQYPILDKKIQFIFTGSIGLDSLVNKLNLSDLINVLITTHVDPLANDDADKFLLKIIKDSDEQITLSQEQRQYLLQKVGWLMPYYIELLWMAVEDLCCDNEMYEPTNEYIDQAYETLFGQNYRSYFNHWAERLSRFEASEKAFAHQLLTLTSEHTILRTSDIHNLKQDEQFLDANTNYVFDCLIHDGYLFLNEKQQYQFTSPMLKEWWGRYAQRTL
jgi:hypothetical protein